MPKKILVVEDEVIIAMNTVRVVKNHGYETETVFCGEAAVSLMQEQSDIALILMDIDLGRGIDGTQAAEQILGKHEIPIVFLTSHCEKEMVEKVRGITCYGYVLKSSGEFVLMEAIQMAFELFEKAPAGIFLTSSSGKALQANRKMACIVEAFISEEAVAYFSDLESGLYVDAERRRELLKSLGETGKVDDF
jgi:CheY-like chemotaxis protein